MKKELQNIYDQTIEHHSFLDKNAVEKCMEQSYILGRREVLDWLSNMKHLSENVDYLIEEFINQNK